MANLTPPLPHLIKVKYHEKLAYLTPGMVIYIRGFDKYTLFYTNDQTGENECRVYRAAHNLGYFDYLAMFGFVRVHQSYMVNVHYLLHINDDNHVLLLCDWKHEHIQLTDTYRTKLSLFAQKPEITV